MGETRVLYYGGLWPTNIGNAFIDIGALYLLRKVLPSARIYRASRFSRFYAQHRARRRWPFLQNEWKPLDIAKYGDVDYVIVAGNVTHTDFIRIEGPTIHALVERGARFVILGGGCSVYTEGEKRAFREFMRSVQTYALISRDRYAYHAFRDAAQLSYGGIDCAFFLPNTYDPMPLQLDKYVVCTFDDQELEKELNLGDVHVVRARHYCFGIRERFVKKLDDTLVSDIPYDYLTLYAGAEAVHSDRVHACVATLSYGNRARLYSDTSRAQLFAEVGAADIQSRLVTVDRDLLQERKQREFEFLASVLKKTC